MQLNKSFLLTVFGFFLVATASLYATPAPENFLISKLSGDVKMDFTGVPVPANEKIFSFRKEFQVEKRKAHILCVIGLDKSEERTLTKSITFKSPIFSKLSKGSISYYFQTRDESVSLECMIGFIRVQNNGDWEWAGAGEPWEQGMTVGNIQQAFGHSNNRPRLIIHLGTNNQAALPHSRQNLEYTRSNKNRVDDPVHGE